MRLVRTQGQLRPLARATGTVFQRPVASSPRQFPTVTRNYTTPPTKPTAPSAPSAPSLPSPPSPPKRSRLYSAGRAFLYIVVGVPVIGTAAWYTYDALEAKGDILHQKRPRRIMGGPKNLVMTHGCSGSVLKAEEIHDNDPRQRLVILGSGWGVSPGRYIAPFDEQLTSYSQGLTVAILSCCHHRLSRSLINSTLKNSMLPLYPQRELPEIGYLYEDIRAIGTCY